MQYKMKDLGYPRTPTTAELHVDMPDGATWAVPLQLIADSRDEHYKDDKEDTIGFIKKESLDDYELCDWAANNLNWEDVSEYARQIFMPPKMDFEDGWVNGYKEIAGTI